jgi:hypothetical protein
MSLNLTTSILADYPYEFINYAGTHGFVAGDKMALLTVFFSNEALFTLFIMKGATDLYLDGTFKVNLLGIFGNFQFGVVYYKGVAKQIFVVV